MSYFVTYHRFAKKIEGIDCHGCKLRYGLTSSVKLTCVHSYNSL